VSPDLWFLTFGQMLPQDKDRLLAQIDGAEVIVEDLASPTTVVDQDDDVQARLQRLCMTDVTKNFRTWWRHPPEGAECRTVDWPRNGTP
jgi:hypothetical protein